MTYTKDETGLYRYDVKPGETIKLYPQAEIQQLLKDKEELLDALQETLLQIEYLHGKFQETGSGNTVISRTESLIQKHRP